MIYRPDIIKIFEGKVATNAICCESVNRMMLKKNIPA